MKLSPELAQATPPRVKVEAADKRKSYEYQLFPLVLLVTKYIEERNLVNEQLEIILNADGEEAD